MATLPDYKNDPRLLDPAVLREQEKARDELAGLTKYRQASKSLAYEAGNVRGILQRMDELGPNPRDIARLQSTLTRFDYWRGAVAAEVAAVIKA